MTPQEVAAMSDEELVKELDMVQEQITKIGCFGLEDLFYEQLLLAEYGKHGLEGNGGDVE